MAVIMMKVKPLLCHLHSKHVLDALGRILSILRSSGVSGLAALDTLTQATQPGVIRS